MIDPLITMKHVAPKLFFPPITRPPAVKTHVQCETNTLRYIFLARTSKISSQITTIAQITPTAKYIHSIFDMLQQQHRQQQHQQMPPPPPIPCLDTYGMVAATVDRSASWHSLLMLSPRQQQGVSVIFLPDDISPEMLHATLSHAVDWNEVSIAPELVNPGFAASDICTANSGNTTTSMGSPEDTPLASPTASSSSHGGFLFGDETGEPGNMGPMRHRRRRSSSASPMMNPYGSPLPSSGVSAANLLEVVPEEVLQCASMSPDMMQTLSRLFAPLHMMENHSLETMSFPLIHDSTIATATDASNRSTTAADPTFGAMLEHQKRQRSEIEESILSVNYDDVTVTQMKKLLRQSNLPACGKKSELMERLRREGKRLSKQRLSSVSSMEKVTSAAETPEAAASTAAAAVSPFAHKRYLKRDQLLVQPPAFLKTLDSLDSYCKRDLFQLMSPSWTPTDGPTKWMMQ